MFPWLRKFVCGSVSTLCDPKRQNYKVTDGSKRVGGRLQRTPEKRFLPQESHVQPNWTAREGSKLLPPRQRSREENLPLRDRRCVGGLNLGHFVSRGSLRNVQRHWLSQLKVNYQHVAGGSHRGCYGRDTMHRTFPQPPQQRITRSNTSLVPRLGNWGLHKSLLNVSSKPNGPPSINF